jgi:hypothetical protein
MDAECRRIVCNVRWLFRLTELGYRYAEHHQAHGGDYAQRQA